MMGVTFASVSPIPSMAAAPDIGPLGSCGSVIAAGIFGIVAAPFISQLLPLFPPVVTGTIILVIGVSLMRVGINWAGGYNLFVVAISVGFGMIPLAAPSFFRDLPHDLQPLLESGDSVGAACLRSAAAIGGIAPRRDQ